MLAPYMHVYSTRAFVLDYDEPPEPLASAIRGLNTSSEPLQGAAISAVLDREIVDKVVKQR